MSSLAAGSRERVDPINRLILELARLPGLGERSAARLAFYLVKQAQKGTGNSLAHDLARALTDAVERLGFCARCRNLCAEERCVICDDARRDDTLLCVVESVPDLRALDASGSYRGRYFVLHGAIAPLEGVGPEDLDLNRLVAHVREGVVREVILATNADVEGDTTALYVAELLRPLGVRITRLASGVPLGGELEFIDQATLGRALTERRDV